MSSRLKWQGFINSAQFPSLQPLRYPLKILPFDNYFSASFVDKKAVDRLRANYSTQSNDVILSSYPKSGNYFLNKICSEIMRNADKDKVHELYKTGDIGTNSFPHIEHFVSVYNENEFIERIEWTSNTLRFWFGHIPLNMLPFKSINKNTKIISMIRDPKDVIISNYHYMSKIAQHLDIGESTHCSMDDYISYILRGICIGGCYFDFYEKYWNAYKNGYCQQFGDINVLFIYYEDLITSNKEKTKKNIEKIAKFLGKDNSLNNEDYENILKNIQFDSMKKELKENPQTFELGDIHLRKGQSGDWQNHLNEKQIELIEETMYFKWAQYGNDIKYYQPLFEKFENCNKEYHNY